MCIQKHSQKYSQIITIIRYIHIIRNTSYPLVICFVTIDNRYLTTRILFSRASDFARVFAPRCGSRWWLIDFARPSCQKSTKMLLFHAKTSRRDVHRGGGRRRPTSRLVRRWETSREVPSLADGPGLMDILTYSYDYSSVACMRARARAWVRALLVRDLRPCTVLSPTRESGNHWSLAPHSRWMLRTSWSCLIFSRYASCDRSRSESPKASASRKMETLSSFPFLLVTPLLR